MKLLSATVRNYRIHRDTTVDLDGGPVLVHGPNESGKSTLVEAIHAALFLKSKGKTALHTAMQSRTEEDPPEVLLEFETGGTRHRLTKRFGQNGQTKLETAGNAPLSGEAAEEALAGLLQVEGAISGGGIENKMQRRWAHLWVWQGASGGSPLASIEESESRLREKLQSRSGQTVLSSATDNAVLDRLRSLTESTLTKSGKAKAGSELYKTEQELEEARQTEDAKRRELERLREAAKNHEQAGADLERYDKSYREAEHELREIRRKLETVETHRRQLKEKTKQREERENEIKTAEEHDKKIRNLEKKLEATREKAAPLAEKVAALEAEVATTRAEQEKAGRAREVAAEKLGQLRRTGDAWQAHMETLDAAGRVADLEKTKKTVEALREEERKLRERLAPLENFTDKAIRELRKKEDDARRARARLEAYALNLELLESDQPVRLDGEAVKAGDCRTLDRPGELQIGANTRIRISPGGAEDLLGARDAAHAAESALEDALQDLAAPSLEAASEKQREREHLERTRKDVQKKLKDSSFEEIDDKLEKAAADLARHRARRDDLAAKLGGIAFPDDRAAAEKARNEAREALDKAATESENADAAEKTARSALEKAESDLAKAKTEHRKQIDEQREIESELNFHRETFGHTDRRAEALHDLRARRDEAAAAERKEKETLAELGAEQLEINRERLEKALETDKENRNNARDRKVAAETELRSSGTSDPETELKEAEARRARLERRHDQLWHQTNVRRYLLERLTAARRATTEALARPLEEAATPYLQLLFGGGRPKLHWAPDGSRLESFELDRTQNRGDIFTFEQLSYGTREQAALALRLAMAELLAQDYDGCLPLVLDDAFTHADTTRIEALKSLLYRASQQGLQILLLTCHPENYSRLGAREVSLAPE